MPYSHTTFSDLKTYLSQKLGDTAKTFWVDAELGIYINEALRTFGLLTGFWRDRGTINSVASTAFYDITTLQNGSSQNLLAYSVTDRNLIEIIQYHFLESASSQSSWTGTEMFTLNDLRYAIQRRRDQFLADTGIVVTRSVITVVSPAIGRETLTDSIMDVRRAAWVGASPLNYYVPLWREDERMLTAAGATWNTNSNTPEAYSIMAPPPLQLQLAPPPVATGQLELLTVNSGAALNPASSATILGIPDDLTPGVKWGAMADLLSKDGPARDPIRAAFCEQRYQQYVQLARLLPVVIHAEINGVSTIPITLQELESSTPNWENIQTTLDHPATDLAICAPNMIALSPVPFDVNTSITLDVVRRTTVLVNDIDPVQIGREQLEALLDYAEHLALFKVGGMEWQSTQIQAESFLVESTTYNQRVSAMARAVVSSSEQSQREKQDTPRRKSNRGIGALKDA